MRQAPAAGWIGAGGQGTPAGLCALAAGLGGACYVHEPEGHVILGDFAPDSVQMLLGPGAMPVSRPWRALFRPATR